MSDSDDDEPMSPPGAASVDWKHDRKSFLLEKMLELEQPVITDKMIDFLLQDGVCETFISFITLPMHENGGGAECGPGIRPRLGVDATTPACAELQRSFRATRLLASDEPTDALLTFLGRKAEVATEALFEVRERKRE